MRLCKQPRQELGAICGRFHQRLVKQMLEHVLTPDVDDEGNLRPQCNEICEVLFRPHTDVYAARLQLLPQFRNDGLISRLVRQKVIGPEIAAWFGEIVNQIPEFFVGKTLGQRFGDGRWWSAGVEQENE